MSEELTSRLSRTESIARLARQIHPEPICAPLDTMPVEVMAEAVPAGAMDAMLTGRLEPHVFRALFNALCPPLECGATGIARVSLALIALSEKPTAFAQSQLLMGPFYAGQGPLTDRRIWAAAATCPYHLVDGEPRFLARDLCNRALLFSPMVGLHSYRPQNLSDRLNDMESGLSPLHDLSGEGLTAALGEQPSQMRLALCVVWALRRLAHGTHSRPSVLEATRLVQEMMSSTVGFEGHLQMQLATLVASRLLSADQAAEIQQQVIALWRSMS